MSRRAAVTPAQALRPLLFPLGLFLQFKSHWCRRHCTTWTPVRSQEWRRTEWRAESLRWTWPRLQQVGHEMSSLDMGVDFTGGKSDSWELSSASKPGGSPEGAGKGECWTAEAVATGFQDGEGRALPGAASHKGWTSGHVMAHALQQGDTPQLDRPGVAGVPWERLHLPGGLCP